jgi:hypothetical protein
MSAFQVVTILAISQVLNKTSLSDSIARRLEEMFDKIYGGIRNAIYDSPTIAIAGGITYLAHQLVIRTIPSLSLAIQAGTEGSLKVAAFVGGVFTLRAALSTYLERATSSREVVHESELIRRAVVYNFFPLAVGAAAIYYASIPIKLNQTALYTAGLIGVMKLLGKGFEYVLAQEKVKVAVQAMYSWMVLERP